MSDAAKAVFLSYASQDAPVATRIADALRQGGVEVWLDQEGGLVGGDAWDRKIREQIATCALFVPLISANTQARKEGYFRLEWHLAEERARLIAKGVPFIVPVSIDGTTERGALVPDAFLAVQWTRIGSTDSLNAFSERVRKLLGGAEVAAVSHGLRSLGEEGRPVSPEPMGQGTHATQSGLPVSSDVTVQSIEPAAVVRLPPDRAVETFERRRPRWRRALPFVSGLIVMALVAGLVAWRLWPKAAPAPVTRFTYRLPEGQTFRNTGRNAILLSPDGRRFVYQATGGLYLRSLDELEPRVIPGTEGELANPVFSPDGQSVGYSQGGQLKRMAISGGAPVVICAFANTPFGASWAPDGTILFGRQGILRVPATGGTPAVVIPSQSGNLTGNPQLLPDGDTVLFTEQSAGVASLDPSLAETRIVAQKISTGARKVLVEGGLDARYLATGHLVYVVGNVLMGVAFDARRLAVTGGAVPVVQGVMRSTGSVFRGTANYRVAADGTLVWIFSTESVGPNVLQLAVSDLAGKLTPLALPPGPYDTPRVSPDGTRVAVGAVDSKAAYIAIYDLDGKTALRRLTFGGNNRYPVWSRDGERVTFQSDREGDRAIFWQRADGTGSAERLTKPEKDTVHVPASWSPKDEHLLFSVVPSATELGPGSLWTYTRASGTAAPFGGVKGAQQSPVFSPDGRWVAYAMTEIDDGGKSYIQPFPATGAQPYQLPPLEKGALSSQPFWSSDGMVLYFTADRERFAAVTVMMRPTVAFGNPTSAPRFFARGTSRSGPRFHDVMPDGRFIGLITPGQAAGAAGTSPPEIRIILNWTEELKRLVPVK